MFLYFLWSGFFLGVERSSLGKGQRIAFGRHKKCSRYSVGVRDWLVSYSINFLLRLRQYPPCQSLTWQKIQNLHITKRPCSKKLGMHVQCEVPTGLVRKKGSNWGDSVRLMRKGWALMSGKIEETMKNTCKPRESYGHDCTSQHV